ncbi:MAG: c-type cytochrome [Herminiimonas sp.]|nr:c-type cytochrome [Herminiimonas sp.]
MNRTSDQPKKARILAGGWRYVSATLAWMVCVAASGSIAAQPPATLADTIAQRVVACTACHGSQGRATADGYYPRIAGKPERYLYNQLINFREGRRTYPMMVYMVDHLSDAYLREIAGYFSSLHVAYQTPPPVSMSQASYERGRILATTGDASRNVAACIECHGRALTGVRPSIPGLIGLPRDYLNAQFGAWKNGTRHAAAPDCMAQLAARLSVDDISAVSGWLASQPIPVDPAPLDVAPQKRPMDCGSAQ